MEIQVVVVVVQVRPVQIKVIIVTIRTSRAKRQYLLTWKVSRYCLFCFTRRTMGVSSSQWDVAYNSHFCWHSAGSTLGQLGWQYFMLYYCPRIHWWKQHTPELISIWSGMTRLYSESLNVWCDFCRFVLCKNTHMNLLREVDAAAYSIIKNFRKIKFLV